MTGKIERKIYFYQITSSIPNTENEANAIDLQELFTSFDELEDDENFIEWGDDDTLGSWLKTEEFPYNLIMGRIRIQNFPRKNRGRNLEALVLQDDEGLAELTHMVFYSNGIVGVEYNHNGPRMSAFRDYVWEKFQKRIFYHSLYEGDINAILNKLRGLSEITMKVSPSMLARNTEGAQGLIKGLKNIGASADCDMIEIRMRNYKDRSNGGVDNFFNSNVLDLCKTLMRNTNAKMGIEKVEIVGTDREGNTQVKNLFEEEFVFTSDVVKMDASRAVDTTDMFKKLRKIYRENQDKLINARRITYLE